MCSVSAWPLCTMYKLISDEGVKEREGPQGKPSTLRTLMSQCYLEGDAVVGCPLDFISTRCHPNKKQITDLT